MWSAASLLFASAAVWRQSLSWDEAVTAGAAERSLPRLAGMLGHTDIPLAAYYLFMHSWVQLAGVFGLPIDEVWLRLPSVLGAAATVAGVCVLTEHWYDRPTAWLAGAISCTAPMLTFYAQDARPYALATAAVVWSTVLMVRCAEQPSRSGIASYAAVAAAAVALQLFVSLALLAHLLYVPRSRRQLFVLAWTPAVALAICLAVLGHRQASEISWIPPLTALGVGHVLMHLVGGAATAIGLLVVSGLLLAERRPPGRPTKFLLAWALLPPVLLVIGAAVTPDLVARYGISAVPALAILLARAAIRGSRRVCLIVCATMIGAAATSVVQVSMPYKYEDYRAAADAIGDAGTTASSVVFLPASSRAGFAPYSRMESDLSGLADAALSAGGAPLGTDQIAGVEGAPSATATRLARYRTLFLVGDRLEQARHSLHGAEDRAQEMVLAHCAVVSTRQFGQIAVTQFRCGTP